MNRDEKLFSIRTGLTDSMTLFGEIATSKSTYADEAMGALSSCFRALKILDSLIYKEKSEEEEKMKNGRSPNDLP